MHKGSCLCGAVHFTVKGELVPPGACHCSQCRKQSSHFFVSTDVKREDLTLHGEENVTWYRSSDKAQRGFCKICGSFLFWDGFKPDVIEIAMGLFEKPTGTRLAHHIYVADKGDYYEITDRLPQKAGG